MVYMPDQNMQPTVQPSSFDAELYRGVVESIQDLAIFAMDATGKVTLWNPGAEQLFGFAADEAIGQSSAIILTPEDREAGALEQGMRTALEKGGAPDERWHLRKDGSRFFASGVLRPLQDGAGGRSGFVKIIRDATAGKQISESLQLATERRAEFIAILGHELRNPIAAIQNAVQLAQGDDGQKHLEWSLRVIERQTRQVSRLLEDLLDVTRASRGMMQLRKEAAELGAILRNAVEALQPQIDSRAHELLLSIPPSPLQLQADAARLEQVFVNLLSNAIKYTPAGGRIILRARLEELHAIAEVEDNGMGIAPEVMPRIFEMFIHASREHTQGGLGIGLPLARRIVELHGGTVTAQSAGEGMGSVFRVELPLGEEASATPAGSAQPPRRARRSARILIIDDNADSATGMAKLLRMKKHEVEIANDGASGLELAEVFCPELVLLDLGLPDMSGHDLAARLRAETGCKQAVLVAVTGFSGETDQAQAKQAGFDHFLIKPVDMEVVFHLIEGLGS